MADKKSPYWLTLNAKQGKTFHSTNMKLFSNPENPTLYLPEPARAAGLPFHDEDFF
jgi:hypothetical protein